MNCPKCSSDMGMPIETDSRQEWFKETYECEECKKSFCREVVYQTQSSLVESDTMEEIEN